MKKILLCASRISHILNFHLPYIQAFQENGYQVDIAAEGTAQHPLLTQCYDLRFDGLFQCYISRCRPAAGCQTIEKK